MSTIINEIESTGEADLNKVTSVVDDTLSVVGELGNIVKDGEEIVSSAEEDVEAVIAEPAHILAEAHSFFDLAKSKLEHVITDVLKHAKNTEEAIEAAILTAFGHASNEVHAVVQEVSSS
jgi:hypothetical protein